MTTNRATSTRCHIQHVEALRELPKDPAEQKESTRIVVARLQKTVMDWDWSGISSHVRKL